MFRRVHTPRIVGQRFNPRPGLTEFSEAVAARVPSLGPNAPGTPGREQRLRRISDKAHSYHRLRQVFRELDQMQAADDNQALPEIFRHG